MRHPVFRHARLVAALGLAALLGGCVYPYGYYGYPYAYGGYPVYAAPPVVGGVFIGGGYGYRRWR